LLFAVLFGVGPERAPAQDTTSVDTSAVDRAAVDTTKADTTDTAAVLLPVFAPAVPPGPLPAGARFVYDLDSLRLSNVYTLSDLLARVPGVYVARGGYFGQAEYVLYAGRGAQGLEIYWDGMPYRPMGRDSVFLDPARIALAPLQRIEVLPFPGVVRVYLTSRREPSTEASSGVAVMTGDRDIARYRGLFARRWRSGAGLSLVGEWQDINGAPNSSSSEFDEVELWINLEYARSPRFGASAQMLRADWHRDAETGRVDRWNQVRRDALVRVFYSPSGTDLGSRFTLSLASTGASADSAVSTRDLTQAQLEGVFAWPQAHARLAARSASRWRPLEIEASASLFVLSRLAVSGDARFTRYSDERDGSRVGALAALQLPLGFSLRGEAVRARDLQAPVLSADTIQEMTDVAWAARWDRPFITLEIGGGRREAFSPEGRPGGLFGITALGRSPDTDYLRAYVALRPFSWVTLAGWYYDPISGGDFEPPYHSRLSATFLSRFWRVFKSGVFVLRGEVAVESWGSWYGGFTNSSRNVLGGATFVESNVQMQIGDVTAIWAMRNMNGMRTGYVPGLDYPTSLYHFGVQWRFRN
jgi:hypothetical protein